MPKDRGWIKLSRKMLDSPIMQHDGLCRLWVYCLMKANWKDSTFLIPGTTSTLSVPRGSFITGRKSLYASLYKQQKAGNPSESTLWRWLQSLEQMGSLSLINVNNHCTMVSVCKYETYQERSDDEWTTDETGSDTNGKNSSNKRHNDCEENEQPFRDAMASDAQGLGNDTDSDCPADEPPMNRRRTADAPPLNTSKEGKKDKKVRREETHRGAFVKPTVQEVAAYCAERGNNIDPQEFIDSCESVGWVVGKSCKPMKNWKATIRTWEQVRAKNAATPPRKQRFPSDEELKNWNAITGLD